MRERHRRIVGERPAVMIKNQLINIAVIRDYTQSIGIASPATEFGEFSIFSTHINILKNYLFT